MVKNILVFSDFGIDDIVAAMYAYFSEEIEIVGIVADYGNVSKADAVRNATYLQRLTGREDIPIFGGAEIPLTGMKPQFYPDVHGVEGLGPISPDIDIEDAFENFDEIKKIIEKYSGNLIIVNIGRLSSLATAFILYPALMKKVKDFYIMGGAFMVPGNVTPLAEANIFGDPYAANILINFAPKPIHIFPLNVTMHAIITPAMVNDLHNYYQSTNNKVGLIIKPLIDYYYAFYKKMNPAITGSPIHDLLTFWALTDNSVVNYIEAPVTIIISGGDAFGKSVGDFRKVADKADYPVHKIATYFHYPAFIRSFISTMKNLNF
ncbi:nucleoside hydrolase [Pseudalkalibacillus decolorationis]|uniref:nucleoside hydrolase n=1 Tax=Pseudalkalibacillus decolorationis TaxID=163879 RepID=UPI00214848E3|nr:nucleoside hydrolase [Pseudalkalibacillus decolorationis]